MSGCVASDPAAGCRLARAVAAGADAAFGLIPDMVRTASAAARHHPALVLEGEHGALVLDYAMLDRRVERVAAALHEPGCGRATASQSRGHIAGLCRG
ncbi:hypothetical protein [Variovorax sp. UMC13]|uniref:hypothetical protein n=1 Tax=Variovorax sp. UMC13 TaxID=1862326 RepID=UPI0015FFA2BC|nr:hypothetical protein [Variovorax sp. UMC13]